MWTGFNVFLLSPLFLLSVCPLKMNLAKSFWLKVCCELRLLNFPVSKVEFYVQGMFSSKK